jgi:hypothetical protein
VAVNQRSARRDIRHSRAGETSAAGDDRALLHGRQRLLRQGPLVSEDGRQAIGTCGSAALD